MSWDIFARKGRCYRYNPPVERQRAGSNIALCKHKQERQKIIKGIHT